MKQLVIITALGLLLVNSGAADDLYKVTLHSHEDAQSLRATGVEALLWVDGGYLVLAEGEQSSLLRQAGLDIGLLASDVQRHELALDRRRDPKNAERFEVIYAADGVRLLRVDPVSLSDPANRSELLEIGNEHLTIEYYPESDVSFSAIPLEGTLQDLVDAVNQDSLYSYVCSLQSYPYREPGTATNIGARDWVYNKFVDLGYDSVMLDPFVVYCSQNEATYCNNVIACKPGVLYPQKHIIVGAHFDAVVASPGADDNGSGVAGVLELARVLRDVDLPMTLVFVAFDSEEWSLDGSHHYVDDALVNGEQIVYMQNMDMIGAEGNDVLADLHYGPIDAYAKIWDQVAQLYTGLSGNLVGSLSASDHYPFQQAGFDVCFVIEHVFSSYYHSAHDSTSYMDFGYMTQIVQATLATVYTAAGYLPPVNFTSVQDPNDGQSLIVNWQYLDPVNIDYYTLLCRRTDNPLDQITYQIEPPDTSLLIEGLIEDKGYYFRIRAYDYDGLTSFNYDYTYGTPSTQIARPLNLAATPLPEAVRVSWTYDPSDLTFSHFAVIRDGSVIAELVDTSYIDNGELGTDVHAYRVVAVDDDGDATDTMSVNPVYMRAANPQPDRILAINRSTYWYSDMVDEAESGAFLREALSPYDYDYLSDTISWLNPHDTSHTDLFDLVNYSLVVVGAECATRDDIGMSPLAGGILDTLAYYMAMGGKVIVFGRWGHTLNMLSSTDYEGGESYDDAYYNLFHIDRHWFTPTYIYMLNTRITADLIGAHSLTADYPQLIWDSSATVAHSRACDYPVLWATGIPSASYCDLRSEELEVIYTYQSRNPASSWENQPVAWRCLESDNPYVFFNIPLSFFERNAAIAALRQAVDDLLGYTTGVGPTASEGLPGTVELSQNYPNPFNPATDIIYTIPQKGHVTLSVFNILGRRVATLVDETKAAGTHIARWDGTSDAGTKVATGIYLYRLQAGDVSEARKMLLLK